MYNSIILSSCLFGSVYLFALSLGVINKSLLENKKIPYQLVVINGLVFVISGSIFVYNFRLVNLSNWEKVDYVVWLRSLWFDYVVCDLIT